MEDIRVDPSQGTHFFQNITSLGIGYFTLGAGDPSAMLDQAWLESQPAAFETEFVRHVSFEQPIEVAINSKTGHGIILKPGVSVGSAIEGSAS